RLHEAEVVNQHSCLTHEEIAIAGNLEVVDRLRGTRLDRLDLGHTTHHSHAVATLQIAGHRPTLADFPEAMDSGRNDRFGTHCDPQGRRGSVPVRGDDGLEIERAGRGVFGEHTIAKLNRLDCFEPVDRLDRSPSRKAGRLRYREGHRYG